MDGVFPLAMEEKNTSSYGCNSLVSDFVGFFAATNGAGLIPFLVNHLLCACLAIVVQKIYVYIPWPFAQTKRRFSISYNIAYLLCVWMDRTTVMMQHKKKFRCSAQPKEVHNQVRGKLVGYMDTYTHIVLLSAKMRRIIVTIDCYYVLLLKIFERR